MGKLRVRRMYDPEPGAQIVLVDALSNMGINGTQAKISAWHPNERSHDCRNPLAVD